MTSAPGTPPARLRPAPRIAACAVLLGLAAALFCPAPGAAADLPQVLLRTSMGEIVVELYPEQAPATVANFLKYVKAGFYDGTLFHRVVDNFMIQGGGYTKDMKLKPPLYPPVPLESRNGLRNVRGSMAMARTKAPDSGTCQFFINVVDNPFLDFNRTTNPTGYAVFGKVIKGMDVVDRIRSVKVVENPVDVDPGGGRAVTLPQPPVVIQEASILERGGPGR